MKKLHQNNEQKIEYEAQKKKKQKPTSNDSKDNSRKKI